MSRIQRIMNIEGVAQDTYVTSTNFVLLHNVFYDCVRVLNTNYFRPHPQRVYFPSGINKDNIGFCSCFVHSVYIITKTNSYILGIKMKYITRDCYDYT